MGFIDRVWPWRRIEPAAAAAREDDFLADLPLRREAATARIPRGAAPVQEGILPFNYGGTLDQDDHLYRRVTGAAKNQRRDLSPLSQDHMIEVSNYLWEQNCLARRLVTLMSDLILGEGIAVEAVDERNQAVIDQTWNHRINQFATNVRKFYNALSVNGELALPVVANPISGIPTVGFIDPYQIKRVETLPDNVLVADTIELKADSGVGQGQRLKVVRENPETGRLEGEIFYYAINGLPNSVRGRSDLLPLADWLDLYDQYMFGEVERLTLLSSFVWDYKVEGATTDTEIADKLKKLPRFKPGSVFGHNEKESLEAKTPDLKASDRSEVARMLRVHIAGSMGYPVSYLGDIDSNKATIEGQNDITLKTPAARQKEFASGVVDMIVRYGIEQAQVRNRSLFRDVKQGYKIMLPEISAKDISRVGQVVSQVMSGMDSALANKTMSRRAAVTVQCAMIKHLGVVLDPNEVIKEADEEAQDAMDVADERQADVARRGNPNQPVPDDDPIADDSAAA